MNEEKIIPVDAITPERAYAVLEDVQLWNIRRVLRQEGIRPDKQTTRRLREYTYRLNTMVFVEDGQVVVSTPVGQRVMDQLRIGRDGRSHWHFAMDTP